MASVLTILAVLSLGVVEGINYPEEKRLELADVLLKGPAPGATYAFDTLTDVTGGGEGGGDDGQGRVLSDGRDRAQFLFSNRLEGVRCVSIKCVYLGNGVFEVKEVWLHRNRIWKWLLSLLAMMMVFALVTRDLRSGQIRLYGSRFAGSS